jgi:V/A-type H+-transporting ATPase subunit D
MAEALEGAGAVASAAAVAGREFPLESTPASIMGVRVADIRHGPVGRSLAGRGYSVAASSAAIDNVAERFESELAMLLDVAIYELRLRRLVDEIGRTTRRVNALENVVIPRLEAERAAIQATLDERERQDRFRLKRIASRTSGRHAFAAGAGSGRTA